MKRIMLIFILGLCQSVIGQDLISPMADKACKFLMYNSRVLPTTPSSFWKDPKSGVPLIGVYGLAGADGWGGAQAAQGIYMNYLRTNNSLYLNILKEYAAWLKSIPIAELTRCGAIGGKINYNPWSDDAGWNINNFVMLYQIDKSNNASLLEAAYSLLINANDYFGTDSKYNSRGLRYRILDDDGVVVWEYTIYTVNSILGALELYNAYKDINPVRAAKCLEIASKFYNFVENYLHNNKSINVTDPQFLNQNQPEDAYWQRANFTSYPITVNTEVGKPGYNNGFLFSQIAMAAVFEMFNEIEKRGVELPLIESKNRDFRNKAIKAADAFFGLHSNNVLSYASVFSDIGSVMVNGSDYKVNGFAMKWWVQYIVPLDPARYGLIVKNTAKTIGRLFNMDAVIPSCWNTNPIPEFWHCSDGITHIDPETKKPMKKHLGEDFYSQSTATTILAAGAWIEEMEKPYYFGKIKLIYSTNDPNIIEVRVIPFVSGPDKVFKIDFSNSASKAKKMYSMLLSAQKNNKTMWLNVNSESYLMECSIYTN